MAETITIIGGTGHTGSLMVRDLLAYGYQTRSLVRPAQGCGLEVLGSQVRFDLLQWGTKMEACSHAFCQSSGEASRHS